MHRIYYQGADALVTEHQFVWLSAAPRRTFAVRHLHNVGLVRDTADRRSDVATVVTAGMVGIAGAVWLVAGPVVGLALGFAALVAATAAVTTRRHRTVRTWQVRATYHGVDTIIYASGDVRVFNQVARALRRSLEDRRPVRSRYGLAAA